MSTYSSNINGKTYQVEAGSATEAKQKFDDLSARFGVKKSDITLGGVAKAGVSGVRTGVEGLPAAPHDIPAYLGRKAGQASQYLPEFMRPDEARFAKATQIALNPLGYFMPSGEDISGVTDAGVAMLPEHLSNPINDWTRHQPRNAVEELAFTGGALTPGLAIPGGSASMLTKLGTRVAAPALAIEGVGQEARRLGMSPEAENDLRILTGLLTGGALAPAEKVMAGRSVAHLAKTNRGALKQLSQSLINEGLTPDEALSRIRDLGVDEVTLMDIGENLRQLGQQVHSTPGEGRATISERLRGRESTANERLQTDIRTSQGASIEKDVVLQELKNRAERVGQQYPKAKTNQVRPANLQAIADDIDAELANARGPVASALRKLRNQLDIPGAKGNLEPSAEGLHGIRQALDQAISGATPGSPIYQKLTGYRKQLSEELKDVAPDIRALDEQYSAIKKEGEAFEVGEAALNKGKETLSPGEYGRVFDAMTPEQQAMVRKGMSREIDRLAGVSTNDRVALKSMIAGDDPASWNYGKIAKTVGEEKAAKLYQALEREKVFKETYDKVIHGSKTAETLTKEPTGKFLYDLARRPYSTAAEAISRRIGINPEKQFPGVAKLLAGDPTAAVEAVRALQGVKKPAGAMIQALLARYDEKQEREGRR